MGGRTRASLLGIGVTLALMIAGACAPSTPAPATGGGSAKTANATPLEQIIAGAKAEGTLNAAGPSNLGDTGYKKLLAAMNQKYGTNIQGTFSTQGNLQDIVAKTLQERATGGKPTQDVLLLNDSYIAALAADDALESNPYQQTFNVAASAVAYEGRAVGFANQLVLPVVNTNLVPPAERPKSWEDLLDPKWKGKVGVHNATHHYVRLSTVWGDEKTTEFVKKLAEQGPRIGLINETYKFLTLGETLISATQTNSQLDTGRRKGEPVDWAIDVRPAIAPTYFCSGLKDAVNRNAAALFCAFMLDKAALDVWGEVIGRQSIYDPSTELGKIYAQDPKGVITWDEKMPLADFEARDKKYRQMLGFR